MGLRLVFPCVLLTLLVLLIAAADAHGGTYFVRQCHSASPQNHSHEAQAERLPDPGAYTVSAGSGVCGQAGNDYALRVFPGNYALSGQYGRVRFKAPAGTKFIGVDLDGKLRTEQGHTARLEMTNSAGTPQVLFGSGTAGPAGWEEHSWGAGSGPGHAEFHASLTCTDSTGCPLHSNGQRAKTYVRNLVFELRDEVAPEVELKDELMEGGWQSGVRRLKVDASDKGSGISSVVTLVNSELAGPPVSVQCDLIPGTPNGRDLAPCPGIAELDNNFNVTEAPFIEGVNDVIACAIDFGDQANLSCATRTVAVDNIGPVLGFSNNQKRADPELIRVSASDVTSGLDASTGKIEYRPEGTTAWTELATELSSGSLEARINSEAHPPGAYEFRASIDDVAGNRTVTRKREDGSMMVLSFPLKEKVKLGAQLGNGADNQTVAYRREGEISGRLRDSDGDPIARESVSIVESFAPGSLIERQERTVETDEHGRYSAALSGGPSRDVAVSYDGSKRYRGEHKAGLDFDVRGKAKLRTSKRRVRAGRRIRFRGAVRRHRAQIPKGGKLVELQVKTGNGWTTLSEATGTDERGHFQGSHKFRGFYTQPVTFIFRLKVTREAGWPYRGSATSKRRRVTVIPKSR